MIAERDDAVPVEGTDTARKDALRRAWLAEHSGEPVRLDAAAVAELAYRLIEAGLQPTVESIRYLNGGHGSPNIIHPAVRQFFRAELRRRWHSPPPPEVPGVPAALVDLWNQCVEAAHRAADSTLEAPRADLARLQATLEQRAAELDARAEQQHAELVATRAQAADLAKRLDRADKALASATDRAHAAESALASVQAEVKAHREAHRTLQAQASAERATLAKERDRWRAQAEEARRHRAEAVAAQDAVGHRLADQMERERELLATLAAAQAQIQTLRDENQQAALQWSAEAAARQVAQGAASQAEQRARLAEDRLQAADARIQQLQQEVDAGRSALLRVARLEGEVQALRDERERLLASVASIRHTAEPNPDGTS